MTSAQKPLRWEDTGCPRGYPVSDIVTDGQVLVVGMHGAGVSTYALGEDTTWINSDTGSLATFVSALEFDTDGTLYAGTRRGRLLVSDDYGGGWNSIALDRHVGTVHALLVEENYLYIGTDLGLLQYNITRSRFEEVNIPDSLLGVVYSLDYRNRTLYAGMYGRVLTRNGHSGAFVPSAFFAESAVVSLTKHKGHMVAATLGRKLYRAQGATWEQFHSERTTPISYQTMSYKGRLIEASDGEGVIDEEDETDTGLRGNEITALCEFGGLLYAGTASGTVYAARPKRRREELKFPGGYLNSDINELADSLQVARVRVQPNPAREYVVVSWAKEVKNVSRVVVADATGRILLESDGTRTLPLRLDVSMIPNGVYYLTLYDDVGGLCNATFVIQR